MLLLIAGRMLGMMLNGNNMVTKSFVRCLISLFIALDSSMPWNPLDPHDGGLCKLQAQIIHCIIVADKCFTDALAVGQNHNTGITVTIASDPLCYCF